MRALPEATDDGHGGNFEEPWCEPDRRIETGEGARHTGLPPHDKRMTMKAVSSLQLRNPRLFRLCSVSPNPTSDQCEHQYLGHQTLNGRVDPQDRQ